MVQSIAFSHYSAWLASASYDKTVKIWDMNSGQCLQRLVGHSDLVQSLAFSHNSNRLASASIDTTVKVWNTNSGKCLQTFKGHSSEVTSVAFSHDSTRVASASVDKTIKVWAVSSGQPFQTLRGRRSSDVSVASFRETNNSDWPQTLDGHSDCIRSLVSSKNSAWLASASEDHTVKLWDISSGKCFQTLKGHSSHVISVAFSQDSTQLASASEDETIKLWDLNSFECLRTIACYSRYAVSIDFSYNSTWLLSRLSNNTVNIWDARDGKCLQELKSPIARMSCSVALSYDSTWLAWVSREVVICDTKSNKCFQRFEGHNHPVTSVAFSYDSTRLASSSLDYTVKIWDTSSGECLHTLEVGVDLIHISFDLGSSYLHTEIGTIDLSVLSTLTVIPSTSEPQYQGPALSSDGLWITYNSRKLVWLPSEYRSGYSAVAGDTICVGVGSDVWMFKVDGSSAF